MDSYGDEDGCGFECIGPKFGDWGFGSGNASDTMTYDNIGRGYLGCGLPECRGFGEGAFLGAGSHDCTGNG
jgi:hypothetical protein